MNYSVKSLQSLTATTLQDKIKVWVESRKHISIVTVNIWEDSLGCYTTIIYSENQYQG